MLSCCPGPNRKHFATQVDNIIQQHSRLQRALMSDPPAEAKFVDNRILDQPRTPMTLDSAFGVPMTPNDINIDDMNCSAHNESYAKFVSIHY